MGCVARMRPLRFLTLSLILLLPLRMGAKEGCDQRKPAEMGPGYFALPLHHAVSLPLRDLPDESASEEAPVRIRPLHRILFRNLHPSLIRPYREPTVEALSNNPRVRPQLKTRSINARSPNVGLGTQPRNRQTNRSENAEVSRSVQFLPSKATGVRRDHRLTYPTRPAGACRNRNLQPLCGNCPLPF